MNGNLPRSSPLERMLADVLHYGTALASVTIAVGLVLSMIDLHVGRFHLPILAGMRVVSAGIALFILLPVLRVVLMLVAFLRVRDFRFGAIAAFVLMVIFLGFFLGLRTATIAAK